MKLIFSPQFIYVYGVVLHDSVGPGSEREFISGWLTWLLLELTVVGFKGTWRTSRIVVFTGVFRLFSSV
jgi:hypothetical protein